MALRHLEECHALIVGNAQQRAERREIFPAPERHIVRQIVIVQRGERIDVFALTNQSIIRKP